MKSTNKIKIEHLGQTGLKIDVESLTVLVDPYLSNSVEELEAADLIRQVPIPYQAKDLTDINWVLITHDHMDHCDPHTIPIIAEVNPECKFVGPYSVRRKLRDWGIRENQILPSQKEDIDLGNNLSVRSIAGAHPKIQLDKRGCPQVVGYIFTFEQHIIYSAGDTSVCDDLIEELKRLPRIDIALLPVNEDNYFRRRRGIIGNMSVREAFELAMEVKVKELIPVHWDMFECNGTSQEEILSIYNSRKWPFRLGNVNSIRI